MPQAEASQALAAGHLRPALLVTAAALIDDQGRVLVQQRPADRHHGGLWEFPGGKLEPGEGPVAALIRELAEELAITVEPGQCHPLGFAATEAADVSRSVVLLLYGCCQWQGVAVSQERASLAWCDPAGLRDLAMPPLDVPLIPLVASFARHCQGAGAPTGQKPLAKPGAPS